MVFHDTEEKSLEYTEYGETETQPSHQILKTSAHKEKFPEMTCKKKL